MIHAMQALVYDGPWQLSLREVPEAAINPESGGEQVLLRVDAVGICGSDVHGFTGESGRRSPGMVMGHEVAATVVETGERVAVYIIDYCEDCAACRAGRPQICEKRRILGVNAGVWGAMAPRLVCPAKCLFSVGKNVDPAVAALAEPIGIAMHAVNLVSPKPDSVVSIVGAGMIGLALTIVLKDRGIETVRVHYRSPHRLAMIESCGGIGAAIDQGAAPQADIAFEAAGYNAACQTAFELTRPGGELVVLGNFDQQLTLPLQRLVQQETIIRGSYAYTPQDFADAVDLVNRKHLELGKLITDTCTLADTPQVMTQLARGERRATKIVIRFQPDSMHH